MGPKDKRHLWLVGGKAANGSGEFRRNSDLQPNNETLILSDSMEIFYCAIAFLAGGVITWLIQSARSRADQGVLTERNNLLEGNQGETKGQLTQSQAQVLALTGTLATAQADLANAERRMQEYSREIEAMQSRLKTEFENLANRILDEKTAKFTAQNQKNLDQLLNPLKTQIGEFKTKVEEVHTSETADRAALRTQIESLTKLNALITEEAKNLTLALKGDSKTQGNWGEMILEKILENSGLTPGIEFTVQTTLKGEEQPIARPDVVINLPEKRNLVIDSKVSLTAYERYCSATDPEEQAAALKEHVRSVRVHVEELAKRKYQDLYQITAPDFVFMFVPIEPAFSRAVQEDRALFNDAFEKKVILLTPSTLLATLRIVAQIWKQEKQTRNTQEIARRSGALYDKFVGLYDDLIEIGTKLNATGEVYQAALNKLKTGRGNLIKSVEDIKKLGAKASKELPSGLVQEAGEEDAGAGALPE
jgi:DNA recombination protein RmuC